VSSLLEVGTGFHPELTGRENVYLNGTVLGMTKAEVDRTFDEIVAFSGVERFIDTPIKRYSSGMKVRLAFSVAAHLEPEVLLVDEVLAVGDAAFQQKCIGKMSEVARAGRTVLFVSHDMQAVSALTQRCLLFAEGQCIADGHTQGVIDTYLGGVVAKVPRYRDVPSASVPRITRVELKTSSPQNVQRHGEAMAVHFEITTPVPIDGAALSFQVCDTQQRPILHVLTLDSELPMCREQGVYSLVCQVPMLRLYPGHYTVTVHFAERVRGRKFQTLEYICPFEVVIQGEVRDYYWYPGAATYVEECTWNVRRVNEVV
jgi:lipopolysaccharide transport system ATP-binding protein